MKKFAYYQGTIVGSCGISTLYDFQDDDDFWAPPMGCLPNNKNMDGGCGWILIGFINTKLMRKVYQEACKKYTLVYQSPVRRNRNSGNQFFFCIFDARKQ